MQKPLRDVITAFGGVEPAAVHFGYSGHLTSLQAMADGTREPVAAVRLLADMLARHGPLPRAPTLDESAEYALHLMGRRGWTRARLAGALGYSGKRRHQRIDELLDKRRMPEPQRRLLAYMVERDALADEPQK